MNKRLTIRKSYLNKVEQTSISKVNLFAKRGVRITKYKITTAPLALIYSIGGAVSDSFHGDGVISKRWPREALHMKGILQYCPFTIHKNPSHYTVTF